MAVIRRNVVTNEDARRAFIEGVRALKSETANGISTYDSLVIAHYEAMHQPSPPGGGNGRNAAHLGPVFLPWHRFFLMLLEMHIQRVLAFPGFGLPYWTWEADGELPEADQRTAAVWADECMGQFAEAPDTWPIRFEPLPTLNLITNPVARGLTRAFPSGVTLPTKSETTAALQFDQYDEAPWISTSRGFRGALEGFIPLKPEGMLHNRVHFWIGGDMTKSTSPNDPVFFLHHANVDRIWTAWMRDHPNAGYVPGNDAPDALNLHRIGDRMFFPAFPDAPTPADVLDVSLIYEYDTLVV